MPLDPNVVAVLEEHFRTHRTNDDGTSPAHLGSSRASRSHRAVPWGIALGVAAVAAWSGCATLQQVTALRRVEFNLERVSDVRIAGIRVDGHHRFSDLTVSEVARLTAAVASEQVPLDLVVHVEARNPPDNHVAAQLVDVEWTLFLEDRETTQGRVAGTRPIPPGQTIDVPIAASLDIVRFVRGNARDLFELALALSGSGGAAKEVRMDLVPTVETSLGRIRYPSRITVRRTVGG